MRLVRRLDWFGRLQHLTYDDAVERWPEVARGSLGDGLRVRFSDSTTTVGIDAVRSIAVRMPLTVVPGLLLWLPGVHALGAVVYRSIAARRQRLGGADACAM